MTITGKIIGESLTLKGGLQITLEINEKAKAIEELEPLKDADLLDIEIVKHRKSRSLNANAYFWQLLDKMAKKVGSDKNTMYLLQLSKYGVFTDVKLKPEALPVLKEHFRYIEEFDDGYDDMKIVRCYYGSSGYNSKEMAELINGTVNDAKDLGVETLTPEEIERILALWKGTKNG